MRLLYSRSASPQPTAFAAYHTYLEKVLGRHACCIRHPRAAGVHIARASRWAWSEETCLPGFSLIRALPNLYLLTAPNNSRRRPRSPSGGLCRHDSATLTPPAENAGLYRGLKELCENGGLTRGGGGGGGQAARELQGVCSIVNADRGKQPAVAKPFDKGRDPAGGVSRRADLEGPRFGWWVRVPPRLMEIERAGLLPCGLQTIAQTPR